MRFEKISGVGVPIDTPFWTLKCVSDHRFHFRLGDMFGVSADNLL